MTKTQSKGFLRNALRSLINKVGGTKISDPEFVKAMIPSSWFTKKGPGVEDTTYRAFREMTLEQRVVAVERGWIDENWLRWSTGGGLVYAKAQALLEVGPQRRAHRRDLVKAILKCKTVEDLGELELS